jgi:hypothetical protein
MPVAQFNSAFQESLLIGDSVDIEDVLIVDPYEYVLISSSRSLI